MCANMQAMALAEGALLSHLQTSLFTQSTDNRLLMHRQLSRHLVGLWMEQNPTAKGLFSRMLPAGLVVALDSAETVPEREGDMIHQRSGPGSAADPNRKVSKKKLAQLAGHWRARFRKSSEVRGCMASAQYTLRFLNPPPPPPPPPPLPPSFPPCNGGEASCDLGS